MKTTIKGIVHKDLYGDGLVFFGADMSTHGYIPVGPVEFEYEVPADFHPVKAELAALEKKLEAVNTEHADKVRAIRDRISNLQCIEYSPAGAA